MREITKKIMKSTFRIAICSIGGILAVFGIMSGLYFLVDLPDISRCLPFFCLAVLALAIGLSLYFLSIKPIRYFVKSRKMLGIEKIIHNIKIYMKLRKSRMAGMTFFLIFIVSISIWMMSMGNKLTETMTPEQFRVLDLAKLMIYQWYFFYLQVLLSQC